MYSLRLCKLARPLRSRATDPYTRQILPRMALVKCPECAREVSDRATSCPGCGCPLQVAEPPSNPTSAHTAGPSRPSKITQPTGSNNAKGCQGCLLMVVGIVLLLMLIGMCSDGGGSAASSPYRRSDGRWSDDPSVQLEQLNRESHEKHERWRSDCATGRGRNPECP